MPGIEHRPGKNYRIGPIRGFGSLIREFVRAVKFFGANVGVKVESDDITSATATIDGIRARFAGASSSGPHAWTPGYVSDTEITITGGTLRYGLSTFTPDGSAVAVTADVLNYVYLKLTCSTTFNAGYLSAATISAAAFEASTTAKTDTETAKYVLLFEWENNALEQQHLYWSLGGSFYTHAEDVSGFRTWAVG